MKTILIAKGHVTEDFFPAYIIGPQLKNVKFKNHCIDMVQSIDNVSHTDLSR
jgi:hypothetical protein